MEFAIRHCEKFDFILEYCQEMVLKKGGEPIEDTILFGKYQLIRILGQGRSGTVYLALHLELEEYRAVKQVPKACAQYEQFKKEALLLKRLHHPGIPQVYDLEEDKEYSYLIEEFLEGDSFYDLVKQRGHLNQDTVIRYGIQICDLVHYLHSAEKIPILYLDLQPRNLLLCHEQVKLLDFDHADTLDGANASRERYGTPGYCAPEQRVEGALGIYTDVYQIGALLRFLLTGRSQEEAGQEILGGLGRILNRCTHYNGCERYQSVSDLRQELEHLKTKAGVFKQNQSPSLIYVFAGSRPGAGATHLAIGLCTYLNQIGYHALYEEWNKSNDVRTMAGYLGKEPDSYGIYRIFGIPMKPFYGEAVRLKPCGYSLVVRDFGAGQDTPEQREFCPTTVFLVQGGKWWQQADQGRRVRQWQQWLWENQQPEESSRFHEKPGNIKLLYNHVVPGSLKKWDGADSMLHCLRVPEFSDPFQLGEKEVSFYKSLLADSLAQPERKRKKGLWDIFKKRF